MMINEQQWESIVNGILSFNRLVTTLEERRTEEYIIKCFKLTDDEIEEFMDTEEGSEEELKEACDIVVTAVQALDAITPSFLKWEHIQLRVNAVIEDQDTRLVTNNINNLIAMAIVNAEEAGYDLYGAMLAVNASNMSKVPLCSDFEAKCGDLWKDYEGMCRLIEQESNGRYSKVEASILITHPDKQRVVFRDSNKKVVTPKGFYHEPALKPFINNKTGE